MLLAHKVELRPSKQQEQYLMQLCGISRHLWNQLLHHFSGDGVKWNKKVVREKMYSLREFFPWYTDYSANIVRCSIDNLDNAYKKFFKTKKGYPKFKSKHQKQSFNIYESQKFSVIGRDFRIERLIKLQRKLSKKKKGSNRHAKAKLSVSKLHFRIRKQREALLHTVSHTLTYNYKTICLEDLSISSMTKSKNKRLNMMILDVGMYELRRQLEYKSFLRGVGIHFVDRYYPSSKLHNSCGYKNEGLKLGESSWKCKGCGQQVDRDLNASKNILEEGLRLAYK